MVKQKLFRIDQGPHDVFVGELWFLCFFNMLQGNTSLLTRRFPRKSQQVQIPDLRGMLAVLVLA